MAKNEEPNGKKPVKKFTAWPVEVAAWDNENKGKDGETFKSRSYTIQRAYTTDKGKTWEHTGALRTRDLPLAILALQMAYQDEATKGKDDDSE